VAPGKVKNEVFSSPRQWKVQRKTPRNRGKETGLLVQKKEKSLKGNKWSRNWRKDKNLQKERRGNLDQKKKKKKTV